MLSHSELLHWFYRLGISSQTQSLISLIRSSDPARHVQSGRGNVSGRYPSRKMGVIIQFESHRNELGFIYEYEHDPSVVEYYDQPCKIKLSYPKANGRNQGVIHTPDFFLIKENSAV